MGILMIPEVGDELYPSLGKGICQWIEANLVFGPGDLRGEPARLDQERRALIYRIYEVFPQDHAQAGRRRFSRCALSLRKGTGKTELGAWIAACELHPDAPVRCVGWDGQGDPIGAGVTDPYIPLVAYTEEQSDELAYHALMVVLAESRVAGDFDIGLQRILRRGGDGRAVSLAAAPNARDGALTTFELFDETHRFTLPSLKRAYQVMLQNLPKRKIADAWALELTTAPAIGEGSVAEQTLEYARAVVERKIKDSRLFFFHRQASDNHKLESEADIRAAVIEASGPTVEWSNLEAIVASYHDPQTDRTYWERVWLNRPAAGAGRAFDLVLWDAVLQPDGGEPGEGVAITLGFDGARWNDATALVGTEIATGYQWVVGIWQRPDWAVDWEVPAGEVDAVVDGCFARWNVLRLYCDPFLWESQVAEWAGRYGPKRVVEWRTNRLRQAAYAIRAYSEAIRAGEVKHGDEPVLRQHLGNAVRQLTNFRDDQGERLWIVSKERTDSPHKIDAAMAAVLSWEARNDAIAEGALAPQAPSVYEEHGVLFV